MPTLAPTSSDTATVDGVLVLGGPNATALVASAPGLVAAAIAEALGLDYFAVRAVHIVTATADDGGGDDGRGGTRRLGLDHEDDVIEDDNDDNVVVRKLRRLSSGSGAASILVGFSVVVDLSATGLVTAKAFEAAVAARLEAAIADGSLSAELQAACPSSTATGRPCAVSATALASSGLRAAAEGGREYPTLGPTPVPLPAPTAVPTASPSADNQVVVASCPASLTLTNASFHPRNGFNATEADLALALAAAVAAGSPYALPAPASKVLSSAASSLSPLSLGSPPGPFALELRLTLGLVWGRLSDRALFPSPFDAAAALIAAFRTATATSDATGAPTIGGPAESVTATLRSYAAAAVAAEPDADSSGLRGASLAAAAISDLNDCTFFWVPRPTQSPTPAPTHAPTPLPTPQPSPLPSALPSALPSPLPSAVPTPLPSPVPTSLPTPSPDPTAGPTLAPTPVPTPVPSLAPSALPTLDPTPASRLRLVTCDAVILLANVTGGGASLLANLTAHQLQRAGDDADAANGLFGGQSVKVLGGDVAELILGALVSATAGARTDLAHSTLNGAANWEAGGAYFFGHGADSSSSGGGSGGGDNASFSGGLAVRATLGGVFDPFAFASFGGGGSAGPVFASEFAQAAALSASLANGSALTSALRRAGVAAARASSRSNSSSSSSSSAGHGAWLRRVVVVGPNGHTAAEEADVAASSSSPSPSGLFGAWNVSCRQGQVYTRAPTPLPSSVPSPLPSGAPTPAPTAVPTLEPTPPPSALPTDLPTVTPAPTTSPTETCASVESEYALLRGAGRCTGATDAEECFTDWRITDTRSCWLVCSAVRGTTTRARACHLQL